MEVLKTAKKIGVDVEGTLVDIFTPLTRKAEEKYGTANIKAEIQSEGLERSCKEIPHSEVRELIKEIWEIYKELPLLDEKLPQTIDALRNQGKEISILTASYGNISDIKSWLDYNQINCENVHHFDFSADKLTANVEIMIDDSVRIAQEFANKNKSVVFIEQWWNLYERASLSGYTNIVSVQTWKEIRDLFGIDEKHLCIQTKPNNGHSGSSPVELRRREVIASS